MLTRQYEVLFRYDDAQIEISMTTRSEKSRGGPSARHRSTSAAVDHGKPMLDIMYDLPERQPGQTYTISEPVVREKSRCSAPRKRDARLVSPDLRDAAVVGDSPLVSFRRVA